MFEYLFIHLFNNQKEVQHQKLSVIKSFHMYMQNSVL
uniref:Uncharacterized protein n=1 Tax=Rhizophora mucronata TaxID=61149 RepID=A0A2P2P8C6_RHIMU